MLSCDPCTGMEQWNLRAGKKSESIWQTLSDLHPLQVYSVTGIPVISSLYPASLLVPSIPVPALDTCPSNKQVFPFSQESAVFTLIEKLEDKLSNLNVEAYN